MITSLSGLSVGTACLPSSVQSVRHTGYKLACSSRGCALGYSSLLKAVPAAFRGRKQLSANLTLPVLCSAAQHAAVPHNDTAAAGNKVPRKRQGPLLSTGCKQHGLQQPADHRSLTSPSPCRSSKAFKKSNSSSRGIIVQQVQAVFSFTTGANLENLFSSLCIALQLLRIETEGAYAGLVAGSPIADDPDTASRSAFLLSPPVPAAWRLSSESAMVWITMPCLQLWPGNKLPQHLNKNVHAKTVCWATHTIVAWPHTQT